MKPGDIRDKKELAEELKQAADKAAKKLSSELKVEAPPREAKKLLSELKVETPPRQAASGGAMKIIKIVGLIALIVCALNRFFHFF